MDPEHCIIERNVGGVTLVPLGAASCTVNGIAVSEPTKLNQGISVLSDFLKCTYLNEHTICKLHRWMQIIIDNLAITVNTTLYEVVNLALFVDMFVGFSIYIFLHFYYVI